MVLVNKLDRKRPSGWYALGALKSAILVAMSYGRVLVRSSSSWVHPRALESLLWFRPVGWLAILPGALELHWLVAVRATPGR